MYYTGVLLGLSAFVCIGLFHPLVIQCEYRFSYRIWPAFLLAGLVFLSASLRTPHTLLSSILGVIGFSCMWSIVELFQQHKRVERGWFKANPKHHPDLRQGEEYVISSER